MGHPRAARAAIAIAICLAAAPATVAADVRDLYDQYVRGDLAPGCAYSRAELLDALHSVPTDIAAYDPAFTDALNEALEAHASGCSGGGPAYPDLVQPAGGTVAADGSPGPAPGQPPPPVRLGDVTAPTGTLPMALLIGGAAGGLGVAIAAIAGGSLARRRPRRRAR